MSLTHFQESTFQGDVLESEMPALVDFTATWCGPCKQLAPVVEQIAGEYDGRVNVGKVDVDECPNIAAKYGIRSVPTLLFIRDGEVVDKITGVVGKDQLVAKMKSSFEL